MKRLAPFRTARSIYLSWDALFINNLKSNTRSKDSVTSEPRRQSLFQSSNSEIYKVYTVKARKDVPSKCTFGREGVVLQRCANLSFWGENLNELASFLLIFHAKLMQADFFRPQVLKENNKIERQSYFLIEEAFQSNFCSQILR
jgi:hypothetical protein